jgi:phosphatidylserine/phosphatidylglycerophosphate/cardiolipin synthase-like enzyme
MTTIAGSGNFDERTLFINDEANLHVLSESLATEQKAMFYRDLKNCKRMTPKDAKVKWKPVDLFNRISAYLVMPQL